MMNNASIETDARNIIDDFKGMSTEAIRMSMDSRRVPAVNVAMNLTNDFNKASCVRSGEAFAFKEFVFVNKINPQDASNPEGIKRWDKRGSVGMHHYANVRHVTNWVSLIESYKADGYKVFAVDNIKPYDPKPVYDVQLPEKTVFIYGEEGLGLSHAVIAACDEMIYIPQFGIPRSLNIASAASIMMHEYARQNQALYNKIWK
jgi:tRNA G18 (ribose-2'-O)-methylase SpoU